MDLARKVVVGIAKLMANILSSPIRDKALRHKVREFLHPLNHKRCFNYLLKRYTSAEPLRPHNVTCNETYVWQCWLQGSDQAPQIVKNCMESVRRFVPNNWKIVFITRTNYAQFVDIPECIVSKWEKGKISNTHFSDVLRIFLLAKYGGWWIDSTCMLTSPIPNEIAESPFFCFHSYGEFEYTLIQSCFMGAHKDSYIMRKWCAALQQYWESEDSQIHYFLLHLLFKALCQADAEFREGYNHMLVIYDDNMHTILRPMLQGAAYSPAIIYQAAKKTFIQKLTYKISSKTAQRACSIAYRISQPDYSLEPASDAQLHTPLVSIILPVYNTANYLSQCIASIAMQTYKEWELIAIDDGSDDGSDAILDQWKKKDSRIHILHQQKLGKPYACNKALSVANGAYVVFVDSDDWLEPDMLRSLIESIATTGKEVAACGHTYNFMGYAEHDIISQHPHAITQTEAIKLFYGRKMLSCLWGKAFKRTLLQEPIPDIREHEDHAVLCQWLSHGNGMAMLPQPLYHYRQRASSIMGSRKDTDLFSLVHVIRNTFHYLKEHNVLVERELKGIAATNYIQIAKGIARYGEHSDNISKLDTIQKYLIELQPVEKDSVSRKTYARMVRLLKSCKQFEKQAKRSKLFVRKKSVKHCFYP